VAPGRVTTTAAALALSFGVSADVPAAHAGRGDCFHDQTVHTTLTGVQSDRFERETLPASTVIDARRARWSGRQAFAIVVSGGADLCLVGGTLHGAWPRDTSWATMHSTGAVLVDNPYATSQDLRVDGYGDSIRFTGEAADFVVLRAHLSDSRDDCIENDWLHSGTVRDSLLDGCYNAFSARSYGQTGLQEQNDAVWRIEQSLIRLQPMERTYRDEGLIPGTAGFFKWGPGGPSLSLHGNVFRADQPANTVGLGIPDSIDVDCSDNVMVWLGDGPFPGALPDCFTVTRDRRVWDNAVADWKQEHTG
jgi:hypothetical protein